MTPQRWVITLTYSNAPGGSGNVKADYLVLVPATSRALGPTGKANDGSTYPKFTRVTTETIRTIRWDLAGFTSIPSLAAGFARDVGLGGQLIEFPTGNVTVAAKLSSLVPDDPTVDATVEQLSHSATLHFAVWPRYHLSRSS